MDLTRPKSSKGRSRTAAGSSQCAGDAEGGRRTPPGRPDTQLRSRSQPTMTETSQLGQDEVLQMLRQASAAPSRSFNRYKVLPSIEGRRPELRSLDRNMSELSLVGEAFLPRRCTHREPVLPSGMDLRVPPTPPDPESEMSEEPREEGGSSAGSAGRLPLLLAVRAPCGRRFEGHFDPRDAVKAVVASAEARYGASYGEVALQSMEVPRRTFTDMDMTFAQCGILDKSLLCICQKDE